MNLQEKVSGPEQVAPPITVAPPAALIDPTIELKEIPAMLITPEQARYWLRKFNPRNRSVKAKQVIDLSAAIRDGMWKYNHAPIVFDFRQAIMEGQHRLIVCVRTDTPIISDVVFGLDPSLRSTYDSVPRSVVDMLVMSGHQGTTSSNHAAAIAKMLETVRRERISGLWDSKRYASKQAVEAAITQNRFPMLDRAAKIASRVRRYMGCPPRIAGFCWYKFAEQDRTKADRFFELFLMGLHLAEEDPVYHLKNRLVNSDLTHKEITALFFKAWILFRDGHPCKRLQWRTELSNPEAFPVI